MAAGRRAAEDPSELAAPNWGLGELVEAAVRSGRAELARDALRQLSEMTRAAGTDWALGIEARSRALPAEGVEADRLYREAVDRLGPGGARPPGCCTANGCACPAVARRRVKELRAAHESLVSIGAEAFAERAGASSSPPARRCAAG